MKRLSASRAGLIHEIKAPLDAVDGVRPGRWDVIGAAVTLAGMTIMFFAPRA